MLNMQCGQDDNTLKSYYHTNITRGLPGLEDYRKKVDTSRPFCLVASGPSLENFHGDIKLIDNPFICAAKTARWLTDKGTKPDCTLHVHPFDQEIKYIDPTVKTDYIVSTQCPPSVFDVLKDNKVYTVNTINSRDFRPPHQPTLLGGTNVAVHAMFMAWCLGFKVIDVFGVDFSYTEKATHINKHSPQGDSFTVRTPHGPFFTSSRMITMAQETYMVISALMEQGLSFRVHSDQLLAYMIQDPEILKTLVEQSEAIENPYRNLEHGSDTLRIN